MAAEPRSSPGGGLRLAIVTNIPAPYRVPVYNIIATEPGVEFLALYAARTEPDRLWNLPPLAHEHVFLQPRMTERNGRYIHHNTDVAPHLRHFRPDVVVSTGFNPVHLRAWAYTLRPLGRTCHHVPMTDGTDISEAALSIVHRLARRTVYATSSRYIAASIGGRRLYASYGIAPQRVHFSPLCANTSVDWEAGPAPARDIDLLFSGRLVPGKNTDLALNAAHGAAMRMGRRLRMAVLGSGPCEAALREQAGTMTELLDVQFAGHVKQDDLPGWYRRSRLFLFPSGGDTWGVVANEACLAGVPVIVTPQAGVAGELVRDGATGLVRPLQLQDWIDGVHLLLSQPELLARMGTAAREAVRPYSFENAAWGIVDAARCAQLGERAPPRRSEFTG